MVYEQICNQSCNTENLRLNLSLKLSNIELYYTLLYKTTYGAHKSVLFAVSASK